MIKTRYTGYARMYEVLDRGYIDTQLVKKQYFVKDILFLGIRIQRKVLFQEEIPSFAWIQKGIFGFTDWKTGCPEEIVKLCVTEGKFN